MTLTRENQLNFYYQILKLKILGFGSKRNKKIDLQIKDIEEIDYDVQKLQYIASSIPAIQNEGLIQLLYL